MNFCLQVVDFLAPIFYNNYHLFMSTPSKGSINMTTFLDVLHPEFWMVIAAFIVALTGILFFVVSVEEVAHSK